MPIDSVSRESIGELIGYVGQNPFVFSGTIAENIAYGREHATEDEIRRAARMACIHEEILAMPGGYDARVAERGQNLSGGQRQRLALARVFLKNPPILILDEGTSALDNISERNVQRAIHAARADRTVILVAHRLSTLLDTDRIFVFDEGRVVETGDYDELVGRGGVFTELVHSAAGDAPLASGRTPAPSPAPLHGRPDPRPLPRHRAGPPPHLFEMVPHGRSGQGRLRSVFAEWPPPIGAGRASGPLPARRGGDGSLRRQPLDPGREPPAVAGSSAPVRPLGGSRGRGAGVSTLGSGSFAIRRATAARVAIAARYPSAVGPGEAEAGAEQAEGPEEGDHPEVPGREGPGEADSPAPGRIRGGSGPRSSA